MEEEKIVESVNSMEEVLCPGKEIAILICGIHALFFAVLGLLFGWYPIGGLMFVGIYGIFSIGCIIATKVIYKDVKGIATSIGQKGSIGNKLATAAIIVLIVAAVISVLVSLIVVLFYGGLIGLSIFSQLGSY